MANRYERRYDHRMSIDRSDIANSRAKIITTAKEMLAGQCSFIEGSRTILGLMRRARVEQLNDPFDVFVLIDSETDAVPLGPVRDLWQPEALKNMAPDWDKSEEWARKYGEEACRRAIALLSGDAENIMNVETVTLWRPVGPEELRLIEQAQMRSFPPRLPEQPIFYPVVSEEYAVKIARDWNVPASGSGFVTRFQVLKHYLTQYDVQEAGGRAHLEYWIPAEDLPSCNDAIGGDIEVVHTFGEASRARK